MVCIGLACGFGLGHACCVYIQGTDFPLYILALKPCFSCLLPSSKLSQASLYVSWNRNAPKWTPVSSKGPESESASHSVKSDSFSPGQNTRVGSHSLLQGIFPTQGSNPGLPHCRQSLYQLSHQGSPRKLEWVAYPFASGSSRPRHRTGVSCMAGGFFTSWATREALAFFNIFCCEGPTFV